MCALNKIILGRRLVSLRPEEALGKGEGLEQSGKDLAPSPHPSLFHWSLRVQALPCPKQGRGEGGGGRSRSQARAGLVGRWSRAAGHRWC